MRAPGFWQNPPDAPGLPARLLAPFSKVYATATRARVARAPSVRTARPVICVGNLTSGGSGKTPTVIALIERLSDRAVHVVSRGYGGTLEGPVRVDPIRHTASDVGDEPLLLAAFAPVWVAEDRGKGAIAAESAGAEVIILDDGFQNPQVAKDLSIVVVDAALGFGNERVIPAGPLREPVAAGLARANMLLSLGETAAQERFKARHRPNIPHITGKVVPLQTGIDWSDMDVHAFAGIAYPEKFFTTLRGLGARVLHAEPLSDHQALTPALMARLQADAKRTGAQLVTTEKDAVRLPRSFRQEVITLPVRLRIDEDDALDAALRRLFSS